MPDIWLVDLSIAMKNQVFFRFGPEILPGILGLSGVILMGI
jgi:hypothetical protein